MGLFHHESLSEKEVKILQDTERELLVLENEDKTEIQALMKNVQELEKLRTIAKDVASFVDIYKGGPALDARYSSTINALWPQMEQNIAVIERVVARLKIEGFQEEKKKFSLLENLSELVADAKTLTKQYKEAMSKTT